MLLTALAALGLAAMFVLNAPARSSAPSIPSASGRAPAATPVYGYRVVKTLPHDRGAWTQGLVYLDGVFYESSGLAGQSSLRKVDVETGKVLQRHEVGGNYFAEGLSDWKNTLVQLTWKHGVAFVYDRATFRRLRELRFTGEGWGLTRTDTQLVLSDGTPTLRLLNPETFAVNSRVQVHDETGPIAGLNELEMVKGTLYANVWTTDRIAMIDQASGRVTGYIDLHGLLPAVERNRVDVLNGIAYDAKGDRLFVTGKWWPNVYQIQVVKN